MTPAEHLARSVAEEAHAGQVDKAGEPRQKRCHWDECPHGENCVHAR